MIGVIVRIARVSLRRYQLTQSSSCIEIGASVGNCVGMRFTLIYCVHDNVQSVQTSRLSERASKRTNALLTTLTRQFSLNVCIFYMYDDDGDDNGNNDVDDDNDCRRSQSRDCVWLCNLHTESKYNKRCRARRIHNVLCVVCPQSTV